MKNEDAGNAGCWVKILPSHIFKGVSLIEDEVDELNQIDKWPNFILLLKVIIAPGDLVKYLPETIETMGIFGSRDKFITVLTEENIPCWVPLSILDFNEDQKQELVVLGMVKEKDFYAMHRTGIDQTEDEIVKVA